MCMYDGILCMHDGILCIHDGKLCMHNGILCMHDGKLCMHDGMLDAIDMLEVLCTLNLTQFTPHRVGRNRGGINSQEYGYTTAAHTNPCNNYLVTVHLWV